MHFCYCFIMKSTVFSDNLHPYLPCFLRKPMSQIVTEMHKKIDADRKLKKDDEEKKKLHKLLDKEVQEILETRNANISDLRKQPTKTSHKKSRFQLRLPEDEWDVPRYNDDLHELWTSQSIDEDSFEGYLICKKRFVLRNGARFSVIVMC